MSLEGTTEEPAVLMEKILRGDKEAARKFASSLSSRQFARKVSEGGMVSQILEKDGIDQETVGLILLKMSMTEEIALTKELIQAFQTQGRMAMFLDCGPNGVEALTNILLKKWDVDGNREKTIQQAIPQLAEKLSKSTHELYQVALLNSLIRLTSSNQQLLKSFGSNLPFKVLLPLLSTLQPESVRSRSIVLLSTLISKEDATSPTLSTLQSQLADFVTAKLSLSTPNDYVTAFSVLAAVFTIKTEVGAHVFLQEGFLEEAVEEPLELDDNHQVVKSLLELLSAAAVDKNCRTRILKVAQSFLEDSTQGENTEIRALAGSVLAKLSSASTQPPAVGVDLLKIFKDAYNAKNQTALLSSIEGLAFSSTSPQTKDQLIKDAFFLSSLLTLLKSPNQPHPLVYGCLSILVNLTSYKPPLNEEQKRINEIRRLAKETDVHTVDELDKDVHVTARCKVLLTMGVVPAINAMALNSSPACIVAIAHVLLSMATAAAHRGILAHQGVVKLILSLLSKQVDSETEISLSHALAKILISVNPSLIFSSRTPITTPIQPLTSLLANDSLPNELPRFEALLALTNLASADDTARTFIVEKSWPLIETLLLNDNALVQRASTELVCNLVVSQKGAEKFIPGQKNPSAVSRLHLVLALADVEDVNTRRAAGGALAMLTDFEEVCEALGEVERAVERAVRMVGDADEDCAFRGVVCVRNLVVNGGRDMKEKFKESDVVKKLYEYMRKSKNEKIKGLCQETITLLA